MNNDAKNLTQRSFLNTAGSLLVYLAFLGAGFISKKYLVVFLGPMVFGVWEICIRLLNYVSPGEGPISQTLKWMLANKSATEDKAELRRYIGGAFFLWGGFVLPILLIGAGIAWLSPRFISDLPPELISTVRWSSFIIVIGLLAEAWSRLYLGVLQGINILYKATWVTSGMHILGMIFMITTAYLGYGLKGIAASLILTALTSGFTYLQLVKSWVPWFGLQKPGKTILKEIFSFGIWMYAWSFVSRLLFMSDLIIVGMLQGAVAVTSLTFTQYAPHVGVYLAGMLSTAVAPGLGRILGEGNFEKVKTVREELASILWLLVVISGVCILAWNSALVNLWVGADKFSGAYVNFLLVLVFAQMAFIRMEAFIIDISLDIKLKVFWGLFSALISISLAFLGGQRWGTPGVLIGLLIGRSILTVVYPILVGRIMHQPGVVLGASTIRPVVVGFLMLGITWLLADYIPQVSWFGLFGFGFLTVLLTLLIALFAGLNHQSRARLLLRISRTGILKRS